MRNKLINDFLEILNKDKPAIICKNKIKTFKELGIDIRKMITVFEKNTKMDDSILVFSYPYRYDFYVSMFAGILSGRKMVIIDSFNDKKKTEYMLKEANCNYYLSDKLFKNLKFKLPKNMKLILNSNYKNEIESDNYSDEAKVITYTSATTAMPKKIVRDLSFLENQIKMINNNLDYNKDSIVYGILPMYTLLSIFLGNTTIIKKNPTNIKANVIIAPIKKLLTLKKKINNVSSVFMGGAILYKNEALKLKSLFPDAKINYIYGASEGALIYRTSLDDYINNIFTYDCPANGIKVSIDNPNNNGIGIIKIEGETVIGNCHLTGDLGKLEHNKLTVLGRSKFSNIDKGLYNYLIDERIRENNPNIIAFSFKLDNEYVCVYKGKLINKIDGIKYIKMKKIPYDIKHKTKLDYGKTIEIIKKIIIKK